ncbi:MAG: glycosyltransferase family 4 protein [Gemmatimonadales bacterium]
MRIGIDTTCWANGRGYGRFTRHLLPAMVEEAPDDEFLCFLDERAGEAFDLTAPNVRRIMVPQGQSPTEAASADGSRSPLDMLRLTRAVWRARPDVFFSPSVYTYFPLPPGLRAVVTVHDAIAERFPQLTLPSWRARLLWNLKVGLAVRQARFVLTVSDFSARDIATHLHVAPARIRVAVEAPAPAFQPAGDADALAGLAARLGVPADGRWFIYVGGFNPHKHVDVIVRAHAAVAAATGADAPMLLLVGALQGDVFHGSQGQIRGAIRAAGTEALVKWTGFLPDEELRLLHSRALALLLPSACEGFGLPAMEAAACGAPVIATTESPLPELLAGGGIFVPPGDQAALTAAMEAMLQDEPARTAMGRRALERARALAWPRTARAALDALREASA